MLQMFKIGEVSCYKCDNAPLKYFEIKGLSRGDVIFLEHHIYVSFLIVITMVC